VIGTRASLNIPLQGPPRHIYLFVPRALRTSPLTRVLFASGDSGCGLRELGQQRGIFQNLGRHGQHLGAEVRHPREPSEAGATPFLPEPQVFLSLSPLPCTFLYPLSTQFSHADSVKKLINTICIFLFACIFSSGGHRASGRANHTQRGAHQCLPHHGLRDQGRERRVHARTLAAHVRNGSPVVSSRRLHRLLSP